MTRRLLPVVVLTGGLLGCAGSGPTLDDLQSVAQTALAGGGASGALSAGDITKGLKEALNKGTTTVVSQLGAAGGFSNDPTIRIPLPRSLQKVRDFASQVGLAGRFDDLENRLNQAAEAATPKARSLFLGAVRDMSVSDARGILQGPDNAATEYFRTTTGDSLKASMRPLIDNALSQVGAVNSFNSLLSRYRRIPGAPAVDADLSGHVVDEASDGIFYYIAEEEKAIRTNPVKRTTEILQRVFGAQ